MSYLRPPARSPLYDPSQPYDPPLTSTTTAFRFSTIAKANINAISAAPGPTPTIQVHPAPSSSSSRPSSIYYKPQNDKDKGEAKDAEDKAQAKARAKAEAKARLTIDPNPPRTPRTPQTAEIMSQVDGALDVMRANMGRLSARGESIQDLEARTESLVQSARAFRKSSKRLRREMQWKEIKTRAIIGFVIAVVLTLTIVSIVQAVRSSKARAKGAGTAVPPAFTVVLAAPNGVPTSTVKIGVAPTPTPTPVPIPIDEGGAEKVLQGRDLDLEWFSW